MTWVAQHVHQWQMAHDTTFASRFLHLLAAFSEEGYHRLSGFLRVGTPPRPNH